MQRLLPVSLLVAASVAAQDHIVSLGHASHHGANAQSHPAFRVKDSTLDGIASVPGELAAFLSKCLTVRNYSTGEPFPKCFYTDVQYTVENGELAFYFAESEEGRILRGVDQNHDGILQDAEVTEFWITPVTGISVRMPDGVAVYRDAALNQTRVYVCGDAPTQTRGIWRLVDLNGDGDAMDAGEGAIFVNAAMNLTVPGTAGPVTLARDDWEQIRVTPQGLVIAYQNGNNVNQDPITGSYPVPAANADAFAFFAFTDNNGTAVPEVFFNASMLNNLPLHPDFAANLFPPMDQQTAPTVRANNLRFLEVAPGQGPLGEDVFYLMIKRQQNRGADQNINGQVISGLVLRAVDVNRNNRIDAGELRVWGNLTAAPVNGVPAVDFTNLANAVVVPQLAGDTYTAGLSPDGAFSFTYDNTAQKAIVTMRDANNNGTIDQGECNMVYYTPQQPTFPFPFHASFGPFIMGQVSLPDGLLPGPFPAGVSTVGDGCTAPFRGLRPVMDVWGGAPTVGNAGFQVGVIRSIPMVPSFLVADFTFAAAPMPLAPLGLPGCFSYLQNPVTSGFALADAKGRTMFGLGIPNNAVLVGLTLGLQCASFDPTNPNVVPYYTSNAIAVTVQ